MTFLNWTILPLLAVAAIPVIIHLLNRRKAQLVDWGAMRFLLASLASRNRRILMEEMILLIVRCLLLALIVLALARPFLPSQTAVPWEAVLPSVLAGVLLLALAGAVWSNRRRRWILLGVAGALIALAAALTIVETFSQDKRWHSAGGEKDLVLVIDGSMSMQLSTGGKTNFQRAIEEARSIVASCRSSDAVSIVLASSRSQAIIAQPTCDRKAVESALASLSAGRGSMKVIEALGVAVEECLAKGVNPDKKILLITDGQNAGWDVAGEHRWKFLAAALQGPHLPTPPQILCRTLGLPKTFTNLAVTDIATSRRVVGTDRKLGFDVKITNTGTSVAQGASVEMVIDSLPPLVEKIAAIEPGASETVHFEHKFDRPGRHLATACVKYPDDLPADNTDYRTINVIDHLGVLIVNGSPSKIPLEGAADFMEVALAPKSGQAGSGDDDFQCMVETKTVTASELAGLNDLSPYRVVVLADVPQLPAQFAADVEQFVRAGGGLLIAAGQNADRDFYNRWQTAGGQPVCPAQFVVSPGTVSSVLTSMDSSNRPAASDPLPLDIKSLTHPALVKLADASHSDAASGRIYSYWPLKLDPKDPAVRLAASLESQAPLMVERKLGKGYVLQSAICFDSRDSNLPTLRCSFVPMMHELIYFLAGPTIEDFNLPPGSELLADSSSGESAQPLPPPGPGGVEIVLPNGTRRSTIIGGGTQGSRASFTASDEPGLYSMMLPESWGVTLGQPSYAKTGLPFVVLGESGESRLIELTHADFERLRKSVNIFQAESVDEMIAAVSGHTPGQELWKYLAIGALLALIAEMALARWIALRRRTNSTQAVTFGQAVIDVQTYRAKAKGILDPTSSNAGGPKQNV